VERFSTVGWRISAQLERILLARAGMWKSPKSQNERGGGKEELASFYSVIIHNFGT
jgi:hypothetical protein